jgi:competence protein ComEC
MKNEKSLPVPAGRPLRAAVLAFTTVAGLVTGRLAAPLITAAGFTVFVFASSQVIGARISADYVGDSIIADVRVADFPQSRDKTVSFIGEVLENPWVPKRVRISWFTPREQVRIGNVWRLELRFRRPRGNSNPGVFDYETWLFRQRIAATGYVVDSSRNRLLRSSDLNSVDALRSGIVERLKSVVVEPDRAAVMAAVTVGARHLVTRDQWDRYAMTGTSHLMAISGLHVGMVAAAGYLITAVVTALFRLSSNQHIVSTFIALACACGYAGISGLAVPAQRSVVMIGLAALAMLRYRLVRPFTVIATACVGLSLLSPIATLAPGFRLSFTAVLILLWIAQRSTAVSGPFGKPFRAVRLLAAAQLALLFGLMPLTVLMFGRIALAAPVVNLAAVPVFSLLTVPLTLCGLMLGGPFAAIGDYALQLASSSLGIVEWMISLALLLPAASVQIPQLSGGFLAALLLPIAWVIMPRAWPGRSIAWIGLLAIILYEPPRPSRGCAQIDVLDVGQGLAIVASTRSRTLLFDTGPAFRSGGSAAESVILPFLAARNIDVVDDLVISHADLDHAGGFAAISRALPIGRLFVGENTASLAHGLPCRKGLRWKTDGIAFEFLYPESGNLAEGNNASCVLQVVAGAHRVLLTGDIEGPAEDRMQRSGSLHAVDVVIVPHHGSRTSSGPTFALALSPAIAIISAGFNNRWGLPDEEVVSRWRAVGADVLNTAHDGAISLRICEGAGITTVSGARVRQRRIWHE